MNRKRINNTLDNYLQIKKKHFENVKFGGKCCIAEKGNVPFENYFSLNTQSLVQPTVQSNTEEFTLLGDNLLKHFLQHNTYSRVKTEDIKKMQDFMMKYFKTDNKEMMSNSQLYKAEDGGQIIIHKSTIIRSINKIFVQVLDDYKSSKNPQLKIPVYNVSFISGRWQVKDIHHYRKVLFSKGKSQIKFNCMLYMLNYIKCLLEHNLLSTKRECFYKLKPFLTNKGQRFTDEILNEISSMLNVGIWELNIKAQTGLVYGDLVVTMPKENSCYMFSANHIPYNAMEILEIKSSACFILVVEKETVFNKLIQENFQQYIPKAFILITGKGFPDKSTQLFLKKLWIDLKIPVLILVDADPSGIEIMMNYRFGSMTNAHLSDYLAVPKAKWIGVRPSEISKYSNGTERLSENDNTKIQKMLKRECMETEENIQKELEVLLEKGVKCEIESLLNVSLVSMIQTNSNISF